MKTVQYYPHRHIEFVAEAGSFSKHSIAMTSYSDVRLPRFTYRHPAMFQSLNPFMLAWQLRKRRHYDIVFVREFSTVPLLLAAPVLWPYRKNTLFVLVHNVQMAHQRTRDRVALKRLFKMGFRFVALESAAGIKELGIDYPGRQVLTLPLVHHGIPGRKSRTPGAQGRLVLGVIGRMRPEKDIDRLFSSLQAVVASGRFAVDILIGCNDPAILAQGRACGFRTMDTTQHEHYEQALQAVDMILVNYRADRYLYRTSGVIADALYRGIVVLCPDFPVFKAQVSTPQPVGATFPSLAELPQALEQAIALVAADDSAFDAYAQYRQPRDVAQRIDQWLTTSG